MFDESCRHPAVDAMTAGGAGRLAPGKSREGRASPLAPRRRWPQGRAPPRGAASRSPRSGAAPRAIRGADWPRARRRSTTAAAQRARSASPTWRSRSCMAGGAHDRDACRGRRRRGDASKRLRCVFPTVTAVQAFVSRRPRGARGGHIAPADDARARHVRATALVDARPRTDWWRSPDGRRVAPPDAGGRLLHARAQQVPRDVRAILRSPGRSDRRVAVGFTRQGGCYAIRRVANVPTLSSAIIAGSAR